MVNSASGEAKDSNTEIIEEFRATGGRGGGTLAGATIILIHHIGARPGDRVGACGGEDPVDLSSGPDLHTGPPLGRPSDEISERGVDRLLVRVDESLIDDIDFIHLGTSSYLRPTPPEPSPVRSHHERYVPAGSSGRTSCG